VFSCAAPSAPALVGVSSRGALPPIVEPETAPASPAWHYRVFSTLDHLPGPGRVCKHAVTNEDQVRHGVLQCSLREFRSTNTPTADNGNPQDRLRSARKLHERRVGASFRPLGTRSPPAVGDAQERSPSSSSRRATESPSGSLRPRLCPSATPSRVATRALPATSSCTARNTSTKKRLRCPISPPYLSMRQFVSGDKN